MKSNRAAVAFLGILCSGCLDFVDLGSEKARAEAMSFPPVIDMKHISPHPTRLLNSISIGRNCEGQKFQVPPIYDRNKTDRLYYLWFFDNKLVKPRSIIEPDFRHMGIITLRLDNQFLMSHFESRIPPDFYQKPHMLEFFVSDLPYDIPESRYTRPITENDNGYEDYAYHEDYLYWIISFSKDAC